MSKYFIYGYLGKKKRHFLEWDGEAITIKGFESLDLFIHQDFIDKDLLAISEGRTGDKISASYSKEELILSTRLILLRNSRILENHIRDRVNHNGLSPRYKDFDTLAE